MDTRVEDRIYTIKEAAELPWLRLQYWTLWDLLRTGRLVRTKIAGKTFIRESELRGLITETRGPAKPVGGPKQKARAK